MNALCQQAEPEDRRLLMTIMHMQPLIQELRGVLNQRLH